MSEVAFTFRQWTTGFVAVILCGLAVYQLVEIIRRRRYGFVNTVTFTAFLVVLSLTMLVDPVSRWLDASTELNNLSWFLGYAVGVLACYFVGYMACRVNLHPYSATMIRILMLGLLGMLVFMSVLYGCVIVDTPEWIARTPRTVAEVIFSTLFFGYGGVVATFATLAGRIAIKAEHNAAIRLRLRVTNWAVVTATLFFFIKVLYLWCVRFFAHVEWINQLALLCMAITGMLWVVVFVPTWLYRWAVTYSPVAYIRRLQILHELLRLQQLLHYLLTPETGLQQESLWRRLTQTSVCIYQTTIAILDYKRLLGSQVAIGSRARELPWSPEQRQQAYQLQELLQAIDTVAGQEIDPLVRVLCRISRSMTPSTDLRNGAFAKRRVVSSEQNF